MNSEPTELADQILKDLGLENLADPTKSELIELIRERVAQKTMEVILANLPDSNPDDLEKMMENKTEEEIIQEISTTIPDFKGKLSNAIVELYQELKEAAQKLIQDNTASV
ncbi:MAG: hypothetical protein WCW17_01415 [Patescibacteria group bacterium]